MAWVPNFSASDPDFGFTAHIYDQSGVVIPYDMWGSKDNDASLILRVRGGYMTSVEVPFDQSKKEGIC